ncbi:guanylate cyclase 32E-like isoform X2 [Centruroides vittatus]
MYVVSTLLNFKWNKIVLIVSEDPFGEQIIESSRPLFALHKIEVIETRYIPPNYRTKHEEKIKDIVETTYFKARIYVIVADKYAYLDLSKTINKRKLLDKGEYIILAVEKEFYSPNKKYQYIKKEIENEPDDDPTQLRSLLLLVPNASNNYSEFEESVRKYLVKAPLCIPLHPNISVEIPPYAGMAYDAVMMFAEALTKVLEEGGSPTDGEAIMGKMRNGKYQSVLGFKVLIDGNGDVEGNYTLLAYLPDESGNWTMRAVARFGRKEKDELPKFILEKEINWINDVPKSEPECGFDGKKCSKEWKIILICTASIALISIAGFFILRHYHYEHKLARLLWKIDIKEVTLLRTNSDYTLQNFRNTINFQHYDGNKLQVPTETDKDQESFTPFTSKIGFYKGNIVYIKPVYKRSIDLTRALRKEMIQMRELRHENINPFIGASVDPPHICVMTLYCSRGSLEDVLKNEDLNLDNMFVASLVSDLIKGMIYLQESEIVSHGNLKSSNCLVDNRWVLQISDFGLHEFKSGEEIPNHLEKKYIRDQLWRAPELLRMLNRPVRGTQKGDVYSFGIILFEIIGRTGPWGKFAPPNKCIIDKVVNPHHYNGELYRPPVHELDCEDYVKRCMEECWQENADSRPDFRLINVKLRDMQAGLKPNIFDNMIVIMEKYANNLEGLIQERTNQLVEEKKKTENLLLRMLPKPVADQLKRGEPVEAESFDSVTIYFSDIVGFTALSAVSTPLQVVDLLNDLYTCFDSIIGNFDVYKVETIGDAYMVVSGLPISNGNLHATQIASMALHLLNAIRTFEIRHMPGDRLKLRIGIHSGPCVAGVVGLKMPRYCLFGDTVNTASRMESTGEAMKIHVSEAFKNILDNFPGFILRERGIIQIKGKGEMRTFWLVGKKSSQVTSRTVQNNSSLTASSNDLTSATNLENFDFRLLLDNELDLQVRRKKMSQVSNHNYSSCLSLFQECRKSVLKEIRKEGRANYNGYRSAPVIDFRDRSSRDCLL